MQYGHLHHNALSALTAEAEIAAFFAYQIPPGVETEILLESNGSIY